MFFSSDFIGSVLLDDLMESDDGKALTSVMDQAENDDVKNILRRFSLNKITTVFSKKELYLATGDLVLVTKVSVALIQSYLSVHRTWDVYQAIKNTKRDTVVDRDASMPPPVRVHCTYSRYHRDFKTNLPQLRKLVGKLQKVPQISNEINILRIMMTMNKS